MNNKVVFKSVFAMVMVGFVLSFSSCKKDVETPSKLSVSEITETTAKLTWSGSADSYEIMVGNQLFTSSTTSHSLTNLTAGTTYTWKVRAKKGDNYSEWATGTRFTTIQKSHEEHPIVGMWEYDKVEIKELSCSDPDMESFIKMILSGIFNETLKNDFGGTFEFSNTGVFVHRSTNGDYVTDYAINGNKLTIIDSDLLPGTVDFLISGNKMYWNIDMLEFVGKEEFEELTELGIEITALIIQIVFTKQ